MVIRGMVYYCYTNTSGFSNKPGLLRVSFRERLTVDSIFFSTTPIAKHSRT